MIWFTKVFSVKEEWRINYQYPIWLEYPVDLSDAVMKIVQMFEYVRGVNLIKIIFLKWKRKAI